MTKPEGAFFELQADGMTACRIRYLAAIPTEPDAGIASRQVRCDLMHVYHATRACENTLVGLEPEVKDLLGAFHGISTSRVQPTRRKIRTLRNYLSLTMSFV